MSLSEGGEDIEYRQSAKSAIRSRAVTKGHLQAARRGLLEACEEPVVEEARQALQEGQASNVGVHPPAIILVDRGQDLVEGGPYGSPDLGFPREGIFPGVPGGVSLGQQPLVEKLQFQGGQEGVEGPLLLFNCPVQQVVDEPGGFLQAAKLVQHAVQKDPARIGHEAGAALLYAVGQPLEHQIPDQFIPGPARKDPPNQDDQAGEGIELLIPFRVVDGRLAHDFRLEQGFFGDLRTFPDAVKEIPPLLSGKPVDESVEGRGFGHTDISYPKPRPDAMRYRGRQSRAAAEFLGFHTDDRPGARVRKLEDCGAQVQSLRVAASVERVAQKRQSYPGKVGSDLVTESPRQGNRQVKGPERGGTIKDVGAVADLAPGSLPAGRNLPGRCAGHAGGTRAVGPEAAFHHDRPSAGQGCGQEFRDSLRPAQTALPVLGRRPGRSRPLRPGARKAREGRAGPKPIHLAKVSRLRRRGENLEGLLGPGEEHEPGGLPVQPVEKPPLPRPRPETRPASGYRPKTQPARVIAPSGEPGAVCIPAGFFRTRNSGSSSASSGSPPRGGKSFKTMADYPPADIPSSMARQAPFKTVPFAPIGIEGYHPGCENTRGSIGPPSPGEGPNRKAGAGCRA